MLIGVPIAMIVLGLVIWALLAGMPFGRDDRAPRVEAPAVEAIQEGDAPAGSNSRELVVEGEEAPTATRAPAPKVATTTVEPTPIPTAVPVPATRTPRPAPAPVSRSTPPPMTSDSPAASPSGDISQSEAVAAVRGYVAARDQYGISSDCIEVTPVEFRNRGYTVSVGDRCDGKSLGRWRIDSQTREIFRQQSDGRFLRP